MRTAAGQRRHEDAERAKAHARARRLSAEYGVPFAVWRGSDGGHIVAAANRRPQPVTWAQVRD